MHLWDKSSLLPATPHSTANPINPFQRWATQVIPVMILITRNARERDFCIYDIIYII